MASKGTKKWLVSASWRVFAAMIATALRGLATEIEAGPACPVQRKRKNGASPQNNLSTRDTTISTTHWTWRWCWRLVHIITWTSAGLVLAKYLHL